MIETMPKIYSDEAVEPLDEEFYIIQPKPGTGYRFGGDAVALSRFAFDRLKKSDRVLDLCSGSGVIGMILNIEGGYKSVGIERDARLFDMSVRSSRDLNGMKDEVTFVNGDVRDLEALSAAKLGKFDAVTCNPPFYKAENSRSKTPEADSEVTVTFAEIVVAVKMFLKPGGSFFLVDTASRLDEIATVCRENKLMPKELVINGNGKTFLMRCVLGGKSGLKVSVGDFKGFYD